MIDPAFATKLVERYGSPLYVYDLDEVRRRGQELRDLLPRDSAILYSLKANPLPAIGREAQELGFGAEISSPGELRAALDAGFAPGTILYTGPGKTLDEIRAAVGADVRRFSCESWVDLERVAQVASSSQQQLSILMRVNPATAPRALLMMSGVESQFGLSEQELIAQIGANLRPSKNLTLAGLHIYFGTQLQGSDAILAATQAAIESAERVATELGAQFHVLDVGGGFPWPYAAPAAESDLSGLREGLANLALRRAATSQAALWFESGRYVAASSGTLLTRVQDVKRSGKKTFVVIDAGINHLGGMSGIGRIARQTIAPQPVYTTSQGVEREAVDVVGPLCTPLDCLGRSVALPPVKPGEILAIPNVGAYGLTASLVHFLSRTPPVEVICRGSTVLDAYRLQAGYQRVE